MKSLTLSALLLFTSASSIASDVWVIGAIGITKNATCTHIRWNADALLYNMNDLPAQVRVIHVSNGVGNDNFVGTLPAGDARAVSLVAGGALGNVWVTHLDVPSGVAVEGRMEYFDYNACTLFPPDPNPLGKLRMPVFTQLTPAGVEQFHLGTDLGEQSVRLNVTVYNAGNSPGSASARIGLPPSSCHNATSTKIDFTVPPDTAIQVPLGTVSCSAGVVWPSYVVVTVDQPSLSFVSTLSNVDLPKVNFAVTP